MGFLQGLLLGFIGSICFRDFDKGVCLRGLFCPVV